MEKIFLSLGTNLGDRGENLKQAILQLENWGVKVVCTSSIYETEPVGFKDQPWFYNMVLEVETSLSPQDLLATLLRIEREMGRKRDPEIKNGPRVIDLDLLFYGDQVLNWFLSEQKNVNQNEFVLEDKLILPHPRAAERKFVLLPLNEIAPDFVTPQNWDNSSAGKKINQLLNECQDTAIVRPHGVI